MDNHNVVYPYNRKLFSDKMEISITWLNLKNAILSERRKRLCILWFHLYKMSQKGKSVKAENRLVVVLGLSWKGYDCKWVWGIFTGRWNVLILDCGDGYATLYIYLKNHWIVHFKWESFMVCKLYLKTDVRKRRAWCMYDIHYDINQPTRTPLVLMACVLWGISPI